MLAMQVHKIEFAGISEYDFTNRLDLRDEIIFTIDSADSKDLDDAISIEKTASNGAPIILRFAPDFSIEVTEIENSTTDKETDKIEDKVENPNTSDDVSLFFVIAFMAVATVIITKRRFA